MESEKSDEQSPGELIHALLQSRRQASSAEIDSIIERMATAPFSTRDTPVPHRMRLRYQGQLLGGRTDSLSVHLVKRVLVDQQWAIGTSAAEYVANCHRAARNPSARCVLFRDWGGDFAATISATGDIVPVERLGPRALPLMFVVYSANDATLRTAYMFSAIALLRLPEDAIWLK
jgi:hypothetical protein